MTTETLKSSLLKLLSAYYGSTSLQLHPVTFSKSKAFLGVFRLFWNLFLAVTSWHYIVIVIFSAPASKSFTNSSTDHHHHHQQQQEFYPNFKQKPLYAISFLLVQLLLPLAIILHVVYFAVLSIVSSPSLLSLLDSIISVGNHWNEQRQKQSSSECSRWSIFLTIIFLDHLFHIICHFSYANSQPEFNGPFRFGLLRYYLAYYVIQQHNLIIMGLLHYYKNATLGALQALFAITTDKDNGDLKVLVDTVEPVICQLATLNRKLNGYLYFPLIVSTVMQLYANLIIFSTAVINGRFQFVQLLYILFFSVHFAYIATLQYRIDKTLNMIERHLLSLIDLTQFGPLETEKFFYRKLDLLKIDQILLFRAVHVIAAYRRHFELKLYRLCSVNLRFSLTTAVFIAGYVVLIAQTTAV